MDQRTIAARIAQYKATQGDVSSGR
jgi:hypothetical protein